MVCRGNSTEQMQSMSDTQPSYMVESSLICNAVTVVYDIYRIRGRNYFQVVTMYLQMF